MPPTPADTSVTEVDADDGPLVVFLGDSLTAGYGLDAEQAFPHLVEAQFEAEGQPLRAVNAGVSGDTTAGGLRRLEWVLRQDPDVLVVALGGNDGLRGLPVASTEDNLRRIVQQGRDAGARVLLAGMRIPPNYGEDYALEFETVFPRLAAELDVDLLPFLLEGVGGVAELNQADGIHPTAEGQALIAELVTSSLRPLVESVSTTPAAAARSPG
ncbi:MAG: arylesterase [Acidobacteriota bacterium]